MTESAKASVARVYNATLGGKDNFDSDRSLLDRVREVCPDFPKAGKQNRSWLCRVVRYLAETAGVDQFLDCGSGLPTEVNVHDIVRRVNPDARVVYVDNDPTVIAFGRALLEDDDHVHFVAADLTHPTELLAAVGPLLDLSRPVALLQSATLHSVEDADDPHAIMAEYVDALAPGSYVAISHVCDPADEGPVGAVLPQIVAAYRAAGLVGVPRTRDRIEAFFDGLTLVEPGVVELVDWWPAGPRLRPLTDIEHLLVGGVARKP